MLRCRNLIQGLIKNKNIKMWLAKLPSGLDDHKNQNEHQERYNQEQDLQPHIETITIHTTNVMRFSPQRI